MKKILINDMEMPTSCMECNFHRYHSLGEYVCVATPLLYPFNLANYKGGRKDFCPLVEVEVIAQEEAIIPINMVGGYLKKAERGEDG